MDVSRAFRMRRSLSAVIAALAFGAAWPALSAEKLPNFVVFMADDMGAKELGCYGAKGIQTPNLDKLAAEGVKFVTCYATPVCHPTRHQIMTGQYGCHNGIYNFSGKRGGPDPDSPAEDIGAKFTFADLLKPLGYATALTGKWQLSGSPPTLIRECGFDEYCVWAYRQYYTDEEREKAQRDGINFRQRYWRPSIMKNGLYVPTTMDDYGPDMFADFAIDFIRRNQGKPFFLYYPMCLTHGPHLPTPDTRTAESNLEKSDKANFAANVEYADKIVGRIVAALEETGQRENTLILFTADNGTGGEGKAQATELGARAPLIANGPGIVKPQGDCLELVDLSDVLPTMAELAGAQLPTDRPIDGVSFASILRGEPGPRRDWIFSYIADRRILRDKRWLLEDNSPRQPGRFYDCGDSRDGTGYVDVTDSQDAEVVAARTRFLELVNQFEAPILDWDGPPNAPKPGSAKQRDSGD